MPTEGHQGMLIYNYRLVGYSVSQVNPQKFAAGAKQKIAQGACNQPETRDDESDDQRGGGHLQLAEVH